MFEELSKKRLAEPQHCIVYNKLSPQGFIYPFQSPDSNADDFCIASKLIEVTPSAKISPDKVQISMPTRGLQSYVLPSIRDLIETVTSDFVGSVGNQLPSIVVLSNGIGERPALRDFLKEFMISSKISLEITLICTEVPGKSNAVNLLHQFALKNSAGILMFVDDDLRIPPGTFARVYEEVADGSPRFIGVETIPDINLVTSAVETDIFNMIVAKRRSMGWPAPIGRFNAMPVSVFPTITRFDVYDDVFLSAFFMLNGVRQYVIRDVRALYKPSTSLFEFIKRTRRVKRSDEYIISILPEHVQEAYLNNVIKPKVSDSLADSDVTWLKVLDLLLRTAERNDMFEEDHQSLDETDLSSKSGHHVKFRSKYELVLQLELKRLKLEFGLD